MGFRVTALRFLSAGVLVTGGAAAVLAATWSPPPAPPPAGEQVREIRVGAAPTTLVCPSEPSLPDIGVTEDEDFRRAPVDPVSRLVITSFPRAAGAGAGRFWAGPGAAPRDLAGSGALSIAADVPATASWARVEPVGPEAALAAGAVVWRTDAGDLRSLVAAPCLTPASESWIVGGSTDAGRSARLELTNPGSTTATVTVEGWGPTGPVALPRLAALALAPETSQTVLLEASTAGVSRLALRVVARGGQVTATLLDTALDGLTPGGVEIIGPTAPPATELVLPGVSLSGSPGDLVRVVNPGGEPALVTIELLTATGVRAVPGADALTVDAGAVFDVSLAGLPAGDHAVRVRADQPVAAAAQTSRPAATADDGTERAWAVATSAARAGAVVIPEGPASARLLLANPGASDAVVTAAPVDGGTVEVVVPAGAASVLEDARTSVLTASAGVHAAVILEALDGTLVATIPLTPDADERQTVRVLVRDG